MSRHLLVDDCGPDPRFRQYAMRTARAGVIVDNDELFPGADVSALRDPLGDHDRVSTRPSRNTVWGEKGSPGNPVGTLPFSSFSAHHPRVYSSYINTYHTSHFRLCVGNISRIINLKTKTLLLTTTVMYKRRRKKKEDERRSSTKNYFHFLLFCWYNNAVVMLLIYKKKLFVRSKHFFFFFFFLSFSHSPLLLLLLFL